MPRIADYSIISDGGRTLRENSSVFDGEFSLNDDAHLGTHGIFIARLHFREQCTNFVVDFRINGNLVFTFPYRDTAEAVMTVHEVVQPGILRRGRNTIVVDPRDVPGGDGRVFVSDMYVMFQRDI